ncbi:MAG: glycosyltransferase family 4 protein [Chloroflexi bacterium]|nr:glycosyltransferase family 4 protein [Chloroflexota bacterium]
MNIFMVGTFPPPVNGMAVITQAFFECLQADEFDVKKIDTSPIDSSRSILSRISRLRPFLSFWIQLLKNNLSDAVVYISLSDGWGQLYDLITCILCRMMRQRLVLHHHNMNYLENKRTLSALLFQAAGVDTIHIALCMKMKNKLQDLYGCKSVSLLSNFGFLHPVLQRRNRDALRTIGYISNITREKGGWQMIRLAEKLHENGWDIKCRIAGPCHDRELVAALTKAHAEGVLEWLGPVYGPEKSVFWNSLDVIIFPTEYVNEAEPLVIWEALLAGVPVIAYDRGCISGQVCDAGKIIPRSARFVESAQKEIKSWAADSDVYRRHVRNATKRSESAGRMAEDQWRQFTANLKKW